MFHANRLLFPFVMCIAVGCRSASADGWWMSPFNGKDLTNFKQLNGKAKFHVEDGAIVGTYATGTPNSFLATEMVYGDFVLRFEFKADEGVNSGVQFRSLSEPDYRNGRVHGYQYEIDTSGRAWTGGVYDEARRGWLYPVDLNPEARKLLKQNDWNTARIECVGNSIRTFLNGKPVAHLIDDETSKGFIAFQVHSIGKDSPIAGKQVRWRNIWIKVKGQGLPLSPPDDTYIVNTTVNGLSDAEKAQGVKLLFDGETTDGWRGAHKDRFPEKGWSVEDGELVVHASGGGESKHGGDIVTLDEYGAFDLSLEFKITPGANSGIKYFVTEGYLKEGERRSAIGLEYQILDDHKHPDAKKGRDGNRTMASLYDLKTSARKVHGRNVPRKVGAWNRARLVVWPDNTVQHYLNGFLVLEYVRGSDEYNHLVSISKYKGWEGFGMAKAGHILLQDHGDEVRFRSVKLRELE